LAIIFTLRRLEVDEIAVSYMISETITYSIQYHI